MADEHDPETLNPETSPPKTSETLYPPPAGYDVWLMNTRGNTFSREHVALDDSQPAYWRFTMDHFAMEDVPATVDYIRTVTGYSKAR